MPRTAAKPPRARTRPDAPKSRRTNAPADRRTTSDRRPTIDRWPASDRPSSDRRTTSDRRLTSDRTTSERRLTSDRTTSDRRLTSDRASSERRPTSDRPTSDRRGSSEHRAASAPARDGERRGQSQGRDRHPDQRTDRRPDQRSDQRTDRRSDHRTDRRPDQGSDRSSERRPDRSDRRPDQRQDRRWSPRQGRPSTPARSDTRRPSEPRRPVVPPLTGPNAFVDLGVPTQLAAVLASQSITEPTPIQQIAIPAALGGRDVLGRGRTGSGKTLSFGLPMLTLLNGRRGRPKQPRGLVLAPTRELAMQVLDVLSPLAGAIGLRVQLVIGGSSYDRQIRGLESADIVVATPGRLVDLAERGSVDLSAVRVVVLDEADHMADLGFMPEIEAILGRLPEDVQGLLFSATLDADVDRLVQAHLHDPLECSVDPASSTVATMAHHVVVVHPRDKDAVTADIALRPGRTVAFVRTQLGADRLAGQLAAEGVRTAALHGGMKQGLRTRTLADFRRGAIDVLVATDVAARGIHVDDIDLVLHVDLPHGPKEYLHRSGRTARAGATGTVVSLATLRQERAARAITAKAGVTPGVLRARPGDQSLRELVG